MLLSLAITLVVFELASFLYGKSGRKLYLNPLLISTLVIIAILRWLDLSYATYFSHVEFLHFLLGPATVALAVPLYEQREKIHATWRPLLGSVILGSLAGILSAGGTAFLWGSSRSMILSLAPKSVTTPIAMGISEKMGGIPSVTAALVVFTGILGAATLPALYAILPKRWKVSSPAAQGFGIGAAAHGVGMARAFQESNEMGTFAGLAIGMNGIVTALFIPLLVRIFGL